MKNKLVLSILTFICVTVAALGLNTFADASQAPSASTTGALQSVDDTGNLVSVSVGQDEQTYTLSNSVWVYRNDGKALLSDLKPGDQVELIFNSKGQVAFVKAFSPDAIQQEEPRPTETPMQQTASPTPSATPEPTASPEPTSTRVRLLHRNRVKGHRNSWPVLM